MRKKVLFMIGTMQSGGVSKSMVNLLNAWDRKKYDTSLLLCCKAGDVFSKYLPKDIHLLYDERIEYASGGPREMLSVIRSRISLQWKVKLFLGIMLRLVLSRFSRPLAGRLIARMMPVICDERYDLIVDYGGQQQLYYMVNKLKGKKKVTFFHNDYSKWPYYYEADKKYYPKVDHIFSISQACVDVLKRYFPDCADKISVMENIVSPEVVCRQAKEKVEAPTVRLLDNKDCAVIVTVAHICRRKGSDLAFDAARLLMARSVKFTWLFVGKVLEPELVSSVKDITWDGSVDRPLVFIGVKSNPYPYMRIADIYCQPSRFEGKSISLDEAKILCKPIVVTNFSTVHDQFEDGINASICDMTAENLADKLEKLVNDASLRQRYSDYLALHVVDNSSQVEILYQMIA